MGYIIAIVKLRTKYGNYNWGFLDCLPVYHVLVPTLLPITNYAASETRLHGFDKYRLEENV